MARKLRVQYPGALYHVLNRGDRREPIFKDDADRQRFLGTLGETCLKTGWQVHAYCLMANHFHLVVETPQANLVAGMKWFLGTYTSRFNRRHKLFGHLFSGRYRSLIVDSSSNGYLRTVCGRLEQALEARRAAEEGADYKPVRRGWFFGDKTVKEELLAAVNAQAGPWHYGEELREWAEAKAERIVAEELKRRKWDATVLGARRKGDPGKLAIARRLREETTMTLAWIAERLKMGTKTHLAHLLYWERRSE